MKILMIDSPQVNYIDRGEFSEPHQGAREIQVTRAATADQLAWADGIIAFHGVVVDEALIAGMQRCRALVKATIGIDDVDVDALQRRAIRFANLGPVGVDEVAEHTLALALHVQRKLPDYFKHTGEGGWCWRSHGGEMKSCAESVFGLLGYGAIGRAVARRAAALGYQVRFHDPAVTQCPEGIGRACTLEAVLAEADIVSLHLPLTSSNRHMMNDQRFSRMKRGASLINTSRGALVDNDSLLRALDAGQLAYALLDVQESEPAIAQALLEHERVALTPHAGFYSRSSLAQLKQQAMRRLLGLLNEEDPVPSHDQEQLPGEARAHG